MEILEKRMILERLKTGIKKEEKVQKSPKGKKVYGLKKSILLPFLIVITTVIAISKQHGDVWKGSMETALSYYNNTDVMQREDINFENAYNEMAEYYYFLINNNIIPNTDYSEKRIINQDQADRMNKLNYAEEFYLFNKSMMTKNESFLYFNENNMDYLKIMIALNRTLLIEQEQKINMIIYKNKLMEKMSPQFIKYVDQYFEEKRKVREMLSQKAGLENVGYTLSGSVYNLLNQEEDLNVFNKDRFYMESRLFAYEMQPFITDLINKGEEVKLYSNSQIKEIRGDFSGAEIPELEEIDHIKSSLKYKI